MIRPATDQRLSAFRQRIDLGILPYDEYVAPVGVVQLIAPLLYRNKMLRALGIYLVIGILQAVLGGGLALALSFLPIAAALGGALVQALALGYSTAVLVVLYFDIRCRKEAYDLAHLAQEVERGVPAPVL